MNYIQTEIDGVWLIEPRVFSDERGYFMEAYKKEEFEANIGPVNFIQDNESKSSFGVLRGLHYQKENIVRRNWFVFLKEKCSTLPLICVNHRLRLESMFVYCLVKKIRDNFYSPWFCSWLCCLE